MKTDVRLKHKPIGELLQEAGKISASQLEKALKYKNEHGLKLGQALVALEYVSESDLAIGLRKQGKIHCIALTPGIVDREVAQNLGEDASNRFKAVAINCIAGVTTVAIEDPGDVYTVDQLAMLTGTKVLAVYAEPSRIQECIDLLFVQEMDTANLDEFLGTDEFSGAGVNLDMSGPDENEGETEDLTQPVIHLVRSLLDEAFEVGASDIHLEPHREGLKIRFRVDGSLYERLSLPRGWVRPIIARIKVLASLDISQRRLPQDGRIQVEIRRHRVDLRVATTPTLAGEGAVLRILDGGRKQLSLDSLGLEDQMLSDLYTMASSKEGFILATGPTGSGKTTTLYAVLAHLNKPDKKIITLEDPVENQMAGATQISANAKIGLTFAAGLRSILRQDPDVVLVGEIRDEETAQIGVQAAQTGHLVLSTLHTVGAVEAITRLADMGVEPYLLGDTLRGIVAQRLIRRLCDHCCRAEVPDEQVVKRLKLPHDGQVYYVGDGCDHCRDLGYKGRCAVYEIMRITPEIATMIRSGASSDDLLEAATQGGMTSLLEHAMTYARAGTTSLDEVLGCMNRG